MRNLKPFVKPMEIKLRSKMSHWPKIPHKYACIFVSYNCFFLPWIKGDLLKINILRQNVVHNSDIGFDSIVHLHIFCIWFTQNCVLICQWQVQSWSFNWNYWFSASRIKKYSLQQRSSSWHIFTNFPITNPLIFSTKCYLIFVLIFSNAQNWE